MQSWLYSCGEQVATLYLYNTGEVYGTCPLVQLACNKLTQLETLKLKNLTVQLQLRQASTRSGTSRALALLPQGQPRTNQADMPAALLPRLQQLSLDKCCVSEQLFQQFGQLTGLTKLRLNDVRLVNRTMRLWSRSSVARSGHQQLLQQLQGLLELQLFIADSTGYALAPLRSMQHLQRLELAVNHNPWFEDCWTQPQCCLPASQTFHSKDMKLPCAMGYASADSQHCGS
jgi:hypothetical protein